GGGGGGGGGGGAFCCPEGVYIYLSLIVRRCRPKFFSRNCANTKKTKESLLKSKKAKAAKTAQKMEQQYRLWRDRLIQAVWDVHGPDFSYTLVECQNLVGLFICVFVKDRLVNSERISEVAFTTVKTGLGGLHGNKGAIAIRFLVDDTSLCFVNCHLAAGQSQVSARNNDTAAILYKTVLPAAQTAPSSFLAGGDGSQILDHECVVFFGDLNYRIDLPRARVTELVAQKEWDALLENDQLRRQRLRNPFFALGSRGFVEWEPRFAPTYKYDPGASPDRYDTSEKKRCPAWCDRVLHRPLPPLASRAAAAAPDQPQQQQRRGLRQVMFRRHECRVSDHKPVSAAFSAAAKRVDPDRRAAVIAQVEQAWKACREVAVVESMVDWVMMAGGWSPRPPRAPDAAPPPTREERAWKALELQGWDVDAAVAALESGVP
ncbi:MAG: Endonuclease/exonuclease/phosphatase, partial [Olpidium bornovanus]